MLSDNLHGVVPALGTPLTPEERVDVPGLRRLINYVLGAGAHGLLSNGSMGGFACLPETEQLRSIATAVEEVGGRVPVIGGLGETGTVRAIAHARAIVGQGVDAISVLPPFYFSATQEQLFGYFSDVAAAVDVPVFLYDNPGTTKHHLHPETIARLAESIPHLAGIKVSNPDCVNLQNLLALVGNRRGFSVLTGSEHLAVVHLSMGCHGIVGGLYNICPHLAAALYRRFSQADMTSARYLQQEIVAAWQIFRKGNIWGAFDEALRYLKICERATPAPYTCALDEADREFVHQTIDAHVRPHAIAAV